MEAVDLFEELTPFDVGAEMDVADSSPENNQYTVVLISAVTVTCIWSSLYVNKYTYIVIVQALQFA